MCGFANGKCRHCQKLFQRRELERHEEYCVTKQSLNDAINQNKQLRQENTKLKGMFDRVHHKKFFRPTLYNIFFL